MSEQKKWRRKRGVSEGGISSVRSFALDVLVRWAQGDRFASDLIDWMATRKGLSSADTAFLQEMVLTTLRNLSLLDFWIGGLSSHRHLDHRTRWVLRLGLAQLLLTGVAPHAAVNSTVAIAGRASGLVNAVLRRADREREQLMTAAADQPLEVRTSHPQFLVDRFERQFGEQRAAALCEWNQRPAEVFIRINPLVPVDERRLLELAGASSVLPGRFIQCVRVPRQALADGWCYVQDPATAVAPVLLDPKEGDQVLDACAAPGGKTALMAGMMNNHGGIVACDVAGHRLDRLRENLQRLGVRNATVVQNDWLRDSNAAMLGMFDKILLDAPCSNTGVMRRRVDVRWRLKECEFEQQANAQLGMIRSCLKHLKPNGVMVYSTCSIDFEENEKVIEAILAERSDLTLVQSHVLFPPESGTDGAYAAKLIRNG